MRWPWSKPKPSKEVVQARQRLEKVQDDDARVNDLSRRSRKIIHENELAPSIMKALGVRN